MVLPPGLTALIHFYTYMEVSLLIFNYYFHNLFCVRIKIKELYFKIFRFNLDLTAAYMHQLNGSSDVLVRNTDMFSAIQNTTFIS